MFQQNDILLLRHIATLEYGRTGGQQPAAVMSHATNDDRKPKMKGLSVSFVLTAIGIIRYNSDSMRIKPACAMMKYGETFTGAIRNPTPAVN